MWVRELIELYKEVKKIFIFFVIFIISFIITVKLPALGLIIFPLTLILIFLYLIKYSKLSNKITVFLDNYLGKRIRLIFYIGMFIFFFLGSSEEFEKKNIKISQDKNNLNKNAINKTNNVSNKQIITNNKKKEIKKEITWYSLGTLHDSKFDTWLKSSYQNRLATSADYINQAFAKNFLNFNLGNEADLKIKATKLENCITNEGKRIPDYDKHKVISVTGSFICMTKFGWIKKNITEQSKLIQKGEGEWYEGGNLKDKNIKEWNKGTYENRLATSADIVSALYGSDKNNNLIINNENDLKKYSEDLEMCITLSTKGLNASGDLSSYAILCIMELKWLE